MPPFESSSGLVFPSPSSSLCALLRFRRVALPFAPRRPLKWSHVLSLCRVVFAVIICCSIFPSRISIPVHIPFIRRLLRSMLQLSVAVVCPFLHIYHTAYMYYHRVYSFRCPLNPPFHSLLGRAIHGRSTTFPMLAPHLSPVFCRRRIYPRSTCGRASRSHYVAV
ncbi:hypothetical protein BD311DRAFT_171624 [Dichomitus squalens]|uniref:Uncharacterized protein n=1 Tax=Dichomitus squalens TaxID=114155 RepID=A0A4Q9MWV1_9APHY|nr:hypothetical protein BD311DRAFT_171624 [Dichomitus squalens]